MNREQYISQVELLLDCLPILQNQNYFGLKGGTAINFFLQDLPRLSVDIDLTYIRNEQRIQAISGIEEGLKTLAQSISKRNKRYQVKELKTRDGKLQKIMIANGFTQVKIEPNFIMRGTLYPIQNIDIRKSVESKFAFSVKNIPVLNEAEIYAGKICAALSRQHPRDFYDVKNLFEKQGITDTIRQAFVIYLVCTPKPIHEILNPNLINFKNIYENEFVNMTETTVSGVFGIKNILFKSITVFLR